MAESIGSLGGVPIGKAGTGEAVILGEKNYKYLYPKEVKKTPYKPLVSDTDVEQLLKEAGTVWRPDQKEAKEKFDAMYTKIKQIELYNKAGQKEQANKLLDDLRNDQYNFANFVKNSKTQETNGLQFENDRERQALLYDDQDDTKYQEWLAKPVADRELNPPIARADDVNYVPYAIGQMSKQMVPDKDTIVRDSGGYRDTRSNTYYTEEKVREAALNSAYNMSGKYMNWWKTKMLNKAVDDDPSTPENEKEVAFNIVSNIGPGGTSKELYDFIARQNYNLFTGRMQKIEKKSAPAPAPKQGKGGGGKTPTVSVVTSTEQWQAYNPNTGVSTPTGTTVFKTSLGEDKRSPLSYVVDQAYANGYVKKNPWAKELFRSKGGEAGPDQFVIRGDAKSVIYDPKTNVEYLNVAVKVRDTEKIVTIPMKSDNEATLESKWMKTGKGGTFKEFRDNLYKTKGFSKEFPATPASVPSIKANTVKPKTPAPAKGGFDYGNLKKK